MTFVAPGPLKSMRNGLLRRNQLAARLGQSKKCLFDVPEAPDNKHKIKVPTEAFGCRWRTMALFRDVGVQDILSFLEYGECDPCGGGRQLCPGYRCNPSYLEAFVDWGRCQPGCGSISCPLCIGIEYAGADLARSRMSDYGLESDEEGEANHELWVTNRYKKLGYM